MKEGRRASSLRAQGSREKNVLEESNCDEGRRSVSGNGNKFLHGVYYFRGGGKQWLYGGVRRIAVAQRCIRRGGRRNRTISHSERRVTAPFSTPLRIVSRLLQISTSPSSPCIITLQNFRSAERWPSTCCCRRARELAPRPER